MENKSNNVEGLKKRGLILVVLGILFIIFGFTLVLTIENGKLVYHLESGRRIILALFDFLVGFILLYLFRKNRIKIRVVEELNKVEAGKITKKQLISKLNYCLTLKSIKNSDFVLDKLKEVKGILESDEELPEKDLLFLNQNLNKLKTIKTKQVSQQQMESIKEICNNLDKLNDKNEVTANAKS